MNFIHNQPVKQNIAGRNGIVRLLLVVVPIIIAMLAISLFGLYRWYNGNLSAVNPANTAEQTFIVEPGSSVRAIGSDLYEQGLIKNATVFSWYVGRSAERTDLQAGTYSLSPSLTVQEIVDKLNRGDIDTTQITIFPGRRLDELRQDLIDNGYSMSEVTAALGAAYDSAILVDRPAGATLEGYILPETYQITADTRLRDIIQRALDEFSSRIDQTMIDTLNERGFDLHQAVILASIVGGENSNPDTQKRIAGIFFNRLEEGMNLGADITFYYAAEITGEEPSPDLDHPYNTRIYGGLPPGPISNFNFSAFEAVVNPISSNYLFYVDGDDGVTYYAETAEEHQSNVDQYCRDNCLIQR